MEIKIIGAKENNLKNLDINIPLKKLVVFTGVSGSGKSSLAFDTIHKEGQRRYLETFSSYARNFIGSFNNTMINYEHDRAVQEAIFNLDGEDMIAIFGGGTRWVNMEIMYPKNPNIILYTGPQIVMHSLQDFSDITPTDDTNEAEYIVDDGRQDQVEHVMCNNFAFGGLNTSLIFRRLN